MKQFNVAVSGKIYITCFRVNNNSFWTCKLCLSTRITIVYRGVGGRGVGPITGDGVDNAVNSYFPYSILLRVRDVQLYRGTKVSDSNAEWLP